jgi:CBS domain-containing protein
MQMVSELMTRNVQFVSPRETVRRAAQMMDELNVGALPVCEGERLVGMVTDRDITVRASSAGAAPDDTVVDDVMSTDVRWCFEDQSLDEVMQQMADTQIRRVPVVSHDDAHRLIGIVSLGDIATRSGDNAQKQGVAQVVEKVSSPSEPDRSSQGNAAAGGGNGGSVRASDTDTGAGLAGSDVLDAGMNPRTGASTGGDPSNVVEVSPEDLVNRNAPGSTALSPEKTGAGGTTVGEKDGVVVRRTRARGGDTSSGETGAPEGIDAGGSSGASGGVAGTSGSPGTGIGAKP